MRFKNPIIESKINFAIAQVFDQMIKSFRELKNAKSKLQSVKPTEAYKCIVESKQNILDFKALQKFIR